MLKRLINHVNLAVVGSIAGLLSLLLGWLTLKPNRLVAGQSLPLWDSFSEERGFFILGLWLFVLFLSLRLDGRTRIIILGITVNIILVCSFLFTGQTALALLDKAAPLARVSLGSGFWITLASIYIVLFSIRRKLADRTIWRHLITLSGILTVVILIFSGALDALSILQEFSNRESRFLKEFLQHIFLFGAGVGIGTVIGIPLGVWATRSKRVERPVFYFVNITQTIPSLALFGLLIAPLSALSFAFPVLRDLGIRGIGVTPAIIALVIYSLLPIVSNTFVGLRQVPPASIDAGIGMGMSRFMVFIKVEIPLAARLIVEGLRTASVQAVGLVTIAALIGAGGLGWFVFQGLGQQAEDLILLGALPIIIMALLVDLVMRLLVRLVTPRGLTV